MKHEGISIPVRQSDVYIYSGSIQRPELLPQQKPGSVDEIKLVSTLLNVKPLRQAKTWANRCGFNVGYRFDQRPVYRLLTPTITSLLPPSPMSLNRSRHKVFEDRTSNEERWSTREELFNARGYKFRPRLRKGWIPSWHTTGINPLHSEDGQISKVLRSLDHLIHRPDNPVDPPR